jgi:Uma2 family endonuclease
MSDASKLSKEEYLALESSGNSRHEFVQGSIFSMTGGSQAHSIICGNLFSKIHSHLKGSGCRVFICDMKVSLERNNSFYYPDVVMTCEPLEKASTFIKSPSLIIEVLSPSTKQIDRREKLVAYQQIESLQEYLIVFQNSARIEMHTRQMDKQWTFKLLKALDFVQLYSLPEPLKFPISDVYEGIELSTVVKESEEYYELNELF